MIPAYGTVFLPQNPSTGDGRFQAAVAFLVWCALRKRLSPSAALGIDLFENSFWQAIFMGIIQAMPYK